MNNYSGDETVNAGTGKELTIKELTELVAKVIGYDGKILWDTTKPNGTPRKLLDVSKATALGWTYKTELEDGIRLSYEDFLNNPMRAENNYYEMCNTGRRFWKYFMERGKRGSRQGRIYRNFSWRIQGKCGRNQWRIDFWVHCIMDI